MSDNSITGTRYNPQAIESGAMTRRPECLPLVSTPQQAITSWPDDDEQDRIGGKATGLVQLGKWGLEVPPAFVITRASEADFPDDLEWHYEQLGCNEVAVRSSAIGEDGADASFAGQFDTVLNVQGIDDLQEAIASCVRSLHSSWAEAYSMERHQQPVPQMCVIVQQMVAPHTAGVLFTADPVSGRHDRLIIDAVSGLGDALMDGRETPDHYELDSHNRVQRQDCVGDTPILTAEQLSALAQGARLAASRAGQPLDMEWAINAQGRILWLQARPVTTLGTDLTELDTPLAADQVVTRCNIGEMMPGAVSPLTFSIQGRAIEYGMQHMHLSWRARPAITQDWTQICQRYGHLFINMSGSLAAARSVGFSNADSIAQSLCGRPVAELQDPTGKAPWWRRQIGSMVFLCYCLQSRRYTADFEARFKTMRVRFTEDSASMMRELDSLVHWIGDTHEIHLRSSAYSALMEGVIQRMVCRSGKAPNRAEQAEAARLLAGAQHVESALLVEQLDEVVEQIARQPGADTQFANTATTGALRWLQSSDAGAAGARFSDFLHSHGHRGFRELCLREPSWADQPESLVITMQATLAAHAKPGDQAKSATAIDLNSLPRALRFLLPRAHDAVRQREHTKSLLVKATHRLKCGYRHLGVLLARDGHLADSDLVFFFTHDELVDFCATPNVGGARRAVMRRKALAFQEKLEFDEVSVGKPEPLCADAAVSHAGTLSGRPVSRGLVEGSARVCMTLAEAAALQPGEILVAPVTDVGWTPYFSLIAGLATDVGSAVSHGAVIAREYGLPAVVNLRVATKVINTGDRIRLDADRGVITVL